jgi:3alpha(or 20beta)-hydroxysteroid dehydrogenase
MPEGRLAGQTVLVSGGAHGIGAAQVRRFVSEGAAVVVGDILADDAKHLANEVGERAVACSLDVRSEEDWAAALQLAEQTFGAPVTGMVNNAGVSVTRMIEQSSLSDYLDVIMVNQVGSFLGLRACLPHMRAAGRGSIVLISSILGQGAMIASSGYVSSKFAIRGLTRVAALEAAAAGIRINCICPGLVDTRMIRAGDDAPDALVPIGKRVPMRLVGQPDMIAKSAAFLLSDDAEYVTGTDLTVDGGSMARIPLDLKR